MKTVKLITVSALAAVALLACGGGLTPDKIKSELNTIVGSSDNWEPAYLSDLSKGMSCEEVKKQYSDIKCEPDEEYSFPEADVSGHKLIDSIKFTFNNNKLDSATLQFKKSLNRETFKKVSSGVFQNKWGELKPEKAGKKILTWVRPGDYAKAQRNYMVDHWELETDFTE